MPSLTSIDCDDTIASIGTGHVFGTLCTPAGGGSGNDGNITFASNTYSTYAPSYAVSSFGTSGGYSTITTSTTPASIAAGDEVMILNTQGNASYYGNVGNYENHYVRSVAGTTLTLENTIATIFGATTSNST